MAAEFKIIIPARYESSRFPGKVLAKLKGREILSWVYERASSSAASAVYVATDDERIMEFCTSLGATAVMTAANHPSGSSRLAEAAELLELAPTELLINLQGDEPLIEPANINQLASFLAEQQSAEMASLTTPLTNLTELQNPNCVKVITDVQQRALYFSRSPVPFCPPGEELTAYLAQGLWQRHLGIYAYRVEFLRKYVSWSACAYEKVERLEMLRALYNGASFLLTQAVANCPPGVDTLEDLALLEEILNDNL